ncbi:major facilitator superfamily domain-containing protein [Xylariales sp. PMI_506]|nr:major facilitator superfamily domain-containing protein [Xylariales sp. PMI_506]
MVLYSGPNNNDEMREDSHLIPRRRHSWYRASSTSRMGTVSRLETTAIAPSSSSGGSNAWIMAASTGFFTIPITKVFETILCRWWFAELRDSDAVELPLPFDIDEDMCKIDTVQAQLAKLFAISGFLDAAIGAIGRRPVYAIVAVGMFVQILWVATVGWFEFGNIHLMWLSSTTVLIGGGSSISGVILYSIVTDVLPASERAAGFRRIHVASMVGNLLAPSVVSALMPIVGPWPLIFTSLVLVLCSGSLIMVLPETKPGREPGRHRSAENGEMEDGDPESEATENRPAFKYQIRQTMDSFKHSFSVLNSTSMVLLNSIYLVNYPVLYSTLQLLNIFVPQRYHIRIAETGYIQTTYGLAHVLVLFVAIPLLSAYVLKPSTPRTFRIMNEGKRDLVFAWGSYLISGLGTLIMAVSPALGGFVFGVLVLSLGSGQSSLIRSTLALYVYPEHRSRLFTMLSVADIVAQLYSPPVLAGLFTLGMRLGREWNGLPYLALAVLCTLASAVLLSVRLPSGQGVLTDQHSTEYT